MCWYDSLFVGFGWWGRRLGFPELDSQWCLLNEPRVLLIVFIGRCHCISQQADNNEYITEMYRFLEHGLGQSVHRCLSITVTQSSGGRREISNLERWSRPSYGGRQWKFQRSRSYSRRSLIRWSPWSSSDGYSNYVLKSSSHLWALLGFR